MKKLTAIFLAAALAACCFAAAVSVAAEDLIGDDVQSKADALESLADSLSDSTSEASDDSTSADASENTSEDAASESSDGIISDLTDESSNETTADSSDEVGGYVNVALGKPYSYANSDSETAQPYNKGFEDTGKLLTDGVVRGASDLGADGAGKAGVTVEFVGSKRTHYITIDLQGEHTVSSVVLGLARRAHNRFARAAEIEVSVAGGDFTKVQATERAEAVDGAPQYAEKDGGEGKDQFFNVAYGFDPVEKVTAVRIAIDTAFVNAEDYILTGTSGYIAQLDELEVMGVRTGDATESSEDSSQSGGANTKPTGDAGVMAFVLLAIVSLAGAAVVAKKSK